MYVQGPCLFSRIFPALLLLVLGLSFTTRKCSMVIGLVASVCVCVCNALTSESFDVESSFFIMHILHLYDLRLVLVYQGRWVKVKVTKAKKT